jgi:hypothetical protein
LTDDSFNRLISGKSRRKLADEIAVTQVSEVNLCESPSAEINQEPAVKVPAAKGKRGRGKAAVAKTKAPRQPRKISYKKALEIIGAKIPDDIAPATPAPAASAGAVTRQRSSTSIAHNQQPPTDYSSAVDLTGDVTMGPQHNHAPLFQKPDGINTPDKAASNSNLSFNWDDDDDDDDDLSSITVNVRIGTEVKKFRHKDDLRFFELFKKIAEDQKVPVSHVFLFVKDKRVYPDAIPKAIGHKFSSIYACRLLDASEIRGKNLKDKIKLKFQSDKWRRPIEMKMSRTEPFSSFLNKLSEQIKYTPDQIALSFDGEPLDMSSTPMDNDMEGGEILDCRIKA